MRAVTNSRTHSFYERWENSFLSVVLIILRTSNFHAIYSKPYSLKMTKNHNTVELRSGLDDSQSSAQLKSGTSVSKQVWVDRALWLGAASS